MRTIVTGGNGFIGSNLVRKLVDMGREVVIVSDFAHSGRKNLDGLGLDVKCIKADLRDYEQALRAIDRADVVFHLAAIVGGIEYLHGSKNAELSALRDNRVIDNNVFTACEAREVRKIVYASSCAVYPMDRQQSGDAVFSEDDLKLCTAKPDGGYGWAKLVGEVQLMGARINAGIARIFNIYGVNEPLGDNSHVVADLFRKAIANPKRGLVVWGDGHQSRDFMYVSDCVEALLTLEDKASNPPLVVNIGSGIATTIETLAGKIASLCGAKPKLVYEPKNLPDPRSRTADITRAREMLGWKPKVSLDEGLRKTYEWIKDNGFDMH